MSLTDMWDGVQSGCVSIPQHGYFSIEPPLPYRVVYSRDGNRHSIPFYEPVYVEFDCPSPPAQFRMVFSEKNPPVPGYDPILRIDAFLGVCGTRGFGLGTPRWFGCAAFNFTLKGHAPISPDWMHVAYHDTNEGSFGLVFYTASPP